MQNSRFPVHTKKSKQALSGLLFCKKCGRAMTCNRRKVKDGEKLYVKKCQSMSDTGVVCGNPGIQAQDVLDAIDKKVKAYRKQLDHNKNKKRDKALQLMQKQITAHKQSLKNLEDGFGRIRNMYRLGVISDEEFMKDIKKNKEELESTQNNLRSLEKQYQYTSAEGRKDLRDRFADFDENFSIESSNPEDVNNLLKTIIEKIFYIREGDDFVLDIKFMWDL
ncbi:zinc ribbon domain-containing protein [Paenibacillus sediminis]|nr:zinc ribbon domain-containing protein [Paenibacillus sediminis]